jgi:glycosyltransferase involved in cell wall biosynthesis
VRNVLVVASHVLSAGVGSLRVVKFLKYLPEFGWQPVVLTRNAGEQVDSGRIQAPVYQAMAPGLEPLYALGRRLFPTQPYRQPAGQDSVSQATMLTGRSQRLQSWLLVPDEAILWVPFAVRLGLRVAREHRVDAIFSTSPRDSSHLVAGSLSQRLGLPWAADFRDPWVSSPFVTFPTPLHRKLHTALERRVIEQSDLVIAISEPIQQDFVARYGPKLKSKSAVIYNGYDPEDFVGLVPRRTPGTLPVRILHSGTFYNVRTPWSFLQALKLLTPAQLKEIEVHFLGATEPIVRSAVAALGLQDTVTLINPVPYRDSLQSMLDADLLLLIPGSGEGTVTTKVFEYMATGKPILSLTSAGNSAAMLLAQANVGVVVDPDSPAEIAAGLLQLAQRARAGQLPQPNWDFIRQFNRRELTRQLALCLDGFCSKTNMGA